MSKKLIWMGGVHGVGKSSILEYLTVNNGHDGFARIPLGTELATIGQQLGYAWEELRDPEKMRSVETRATEELLKRLEKEDIVLDAHFCIYLGGQLYPGFSRTNLVRLASQVPVRGIIHVIANPQEVLKRRAASSKQDHHYPTITDSAIAERELGESGEYFQRFCDIWSDASLTGTLDTTQRTIPDMAQEVIKIYDKLRRN
jgi:adenylate kinase